MMANSLQSQSEQFPKRPFLAWPASLVQTAYCSAFQTIPPWPFPWNSRSASFLRHGEEITLDFPVYGAGTRDRLLWLLTELEGSSSTGEESSTDDAPVQSRIATGG